jgi:hypothetical protein
MKRKALAITTVVLAGGMVLGAMRAASASSEEAWSAFQADVEAACREAAAPQFASSPSVRVDPFGSQSYGLALVSGRAKGADTDIAAICVYDKQTGAVEIGGELPP